MTERKGISGSTLKIIAIITMLVDHTAAVLVGRVLVSMGIVAVGDYTPAYIAELFQAEGTAVGITYVLYQIMRRVIGRLAFPIFCFLLVEGFQKTRDKQKYAGRLLVFAILSEVPFDLAFHAMVWYPEGQNVFFTLLLGFLMMTVLSRLMQAKIQLWLLWTGVAAVFAGTAVLAELVQCDYGAKGIFAVLLLYLFRKNKREQLLAGCVGFFWKVMAMFAFIPIAFYNGKRGLKLKYVFYAFYPLHLLILYILTKIF